MGAELSFRAAGKVSLWDRVGPRVRDDARARGLTRVRTRVGVSDGVRVRFRGRGWVDKECPNRGTRSFGAAQQGPCWGTSSRSLKPHRARTPALMVQAQGQIRAKGIGGGTAVTMVAISPPEGRVPPLGTQTPSKTCDYYTSPNPILLPSPSLTPSSCSSSSTHTHTHTPAYAQTHTHTRTHTRHTSSPAHTYTHTRAHKHTHTRTLTLSRAHTHPPTRTYYTLTHTYTHAHTPTRSPTRAHTHTHTLTRALLVQPTCPPAQRTRSLNGCSLGFFPPPLATGCFPLPAPGAISTPVGVGVAVRAGFRLSGRVESRGVCVCVSVC